MDEREARIQTAIALLKGERVDEGPRKRRGSASSRGTLRCVECGEQMQVPSHDGRCGFCKHGI
jgi:hypothetical protein